MQLATNVRQTSYFTLGEATRRLPRVNGRPIHTRTLKRWVTVGIRGVRLKAKKIGDRWFTTDEWLQEFEDTRTRGSLIATAPHPAQADRDCERAIRELERRYGIYVKGSGSYDASQDYTSIKGVRRRRG